MVKLQNIYFYKIPRDWQVFHFFNHLFTLWFTLFYFFSRALTNPTEVRSLCHATVSARRFLLCETPNMLQCKINKYKKVKKNLTFFPSKRSFHVLWASYSFVKFTVFFFQHFLLILSCPIQQENWINLGFFFWITHIMAKPKGHH